MKKLIAVDVETSGLDPKESSLLSIGAVDIANPGNTFYVECRAWEGAYISSTALKINGFTEEQIQSFDKSESEAIASFFDWLNQFPEKPMMVAHNASFDRDFIAEAAKRAELKTPFDFRTIDIHSITFMNMLCRRSTIPGRLGLNQCLEHFGLPKEPTPHNALTGAQCNADILMKILNG